MIRQDQLRSEPSSYTSVQPAPHSSRPARESRNPAIGQPLPQIPKLHQQEQCTAHSHRCDQICEHLEIYASKRQAISAKEKKAPPNKAWWCLAKSVLSNHVKTLSRLERVHMITLKTKSSATDHGDILAFTGIESCFKSVFN